MINKWECLVTCTFIVFLSGIVFVCKFSDSDPKPAQQNAAQESVKCTRCGATCDKSTMTAYKSVGKADILLCPKCVYDQAASFLKFCPVDE